MARIFIERNHTADLAERLPSIHVVSMKKLANGIASRVFGMSCQLVQFAIAAKGCSASTIVQFAELMIEGVLELIDRTVNCLAK